MHQILVSTLLATAGRNSLEKVCPTFRGISRDFSKPFPSPCPHHTTRGSCFSAQTQGHHSATTLSSPEHQGHKLILETVLSKGQQNWAWGDAGGQRGKIVSHSAMAPSHPTAKKIPPKLLDFATQIPPQFDNCLPSLSACN